MRSTLLNGFRIDSTHSKLGAILSNRFWGSGFNEQSNVDLVATKKIVVVSGLIA